MQYIITWCNHNNLNHSTIRGKGNELSYFTILKKSNQKSCHNKVFGTSMKLLKLDLSLLVKGLIMSECVTIIKKIKIKINLETALNI